MRAKPPIEFWFEFASTYSYPSAMRIQDLADAAGLTLRWRPFLLGPIFRQQGWTDSPFNLHAAKGRYMWRDLERVCHRLDLPFRRPSAFPRNGLHAARVACTQAQASWIGEFVRRVYIANFADDRDIADRNVLADCLTGLVGHPDSVLDEAENEAIKTRLRANTEWAAELGIFGAPTFLVDGELFWGNDRLETAIEWAESNSGPAATLGPASV